jgi:hypothetical protein
LRLETIIATSAVFIATYRPETGADCNRRAGTICRKVMHSFALPVMHSLPVPTAFVGCPTIRMKRSRQGIVVMTGSDNGTTLATALIRRAAVAYDWPPLGELMV